MLINVSYDELYKIAHSRGYAIESIEKCIVEKLSEDRCVVDTDSSAYPKSNSYEFGQIVPRTFTKKAFESMCSTKCYTIKEIKKCIIKEDNDNYIIDINSPHYPKFVKYGCDKLAPPIQTTHGPGTELKKLLKTIGIVATSNCSCNKKARIMDKYGCDWCEKNIDIILEWLQEEAKKRKLPFIKFAAKLLVKRAIKNARKLEKIYRPITQ